MVRSMLQGKSLPNYLWSEVVATIVYLLNIYPTNALQNRTPFEAWNGYKPFVSHLQIFCSIYNALIPSHDRRKLGPKSHQRIFVG